MPEKSQNKGQRQDEPQSDDREGKPGKSTPRARFSSESVANAGPLCSAPSREAHPREVAAIPTTLSRRRPLALQSAGPGNRN